MKPNGSDGPHVFVDDLERLELSADDWHHLTSALRLRPGDSFTAADGQGCWRLCRVSTGATGVVEPAGEVVFVEAAMPQLTIGFALIKGGRPEMVTQKLTELGVDKIVPFHTSRSVVRWSPDRAARNIARLRRVAREAAMQSRQVRIPEVSQVTDFADVAAGSESALCDIGGQAASLSKTTLLIGPEGGWSDAERAKLPSVRLSDSVLRSETAAITAAVLLTDLRYQIAAQ